jgi:hypothetical protein
VVVELEGGITVYPARGVGDRWRAVWYESGRRQCEAVAEDKLAAKLARVTERLAADAPNLERPGADLIAWYLCPDRHPAARPWSRRHADSTDIRTPFWLGRRRRSRRQGMVPAGLVPRGGRGR